MVVVSRRDATPPLDEEVPIVTTLFGGIAASAGIGSGGRRLFRRRGGTESSTLQASSSESQRRVDLDRVTMLTMDAFLMMGTLWRAELPSSSSSGGWSLGVVVSSVWFMAGTTSLAALVGAGGNNIDIDDVASNNLQLIRNANVRAVLTNGIRSRVLRSAPSCP